MNPCSLWHHKWLIQTAWINGQQRVVQENYPQYISFLHFYWSEEFILKGFHGQTSSILCAKSEPWTLSEAAAATKLTNSVSAGECTLCKNECAEAEVALGSSCAEGSAGLSSALPPTAPAEQPAAWSQWKNWSLVVPVVNWSWLFFHYIKKKDLKKNLLSCLKTQSTAEFIPVSCLFSLHVFLNVLFNCSQSARGGEKHFAHRRRGYSS